eukprot:COSAG06_NODE_7810_length_2366_cov_1.901191_1_plen_347_part_00
MTGAHEVVVAAQSHPLKARKALRVRVDNSAGGMKRRRPDGATTPCGASAPACPPHAAPGTSCEPAKRARDAQQFGGAPAWGGATAEPSPCSGGAGWFAQAAPTLDPNALDLAPYEAAAAGLVIRDKAFWRLRWAVGQMAGHHRSQGSAPPPERPHTEPFAQAVPAVQLVELLREGWGGVLMTASQARQLRDILASDSANEPRPVDPDVHYALCCRVVDWWNLPLSYTAHTNLSPDNGAAAAVEAYSFGRRLPPLPESRSLVAEMAEQSASVERQLAKCAKPAPWSWGAAPGPPLRQLGLGEASAALESAAQRRAEATAAASAAVASEEESGAGAEMQMSQGSDMEM